MGAAAEQDAEIAVIDIPQSFILRNLHTRLFHLTDTQSNLPRLRLHVGNALCGGGRLIQ